MASTMYFTWSDRSSSLSQILCVQSEGRDGWLYACEAGGKEEMTVELGALLQEHPGRVSSGSQESPHTKEAFLLGGNRSYPH